MRESEGWVPDSERRAPWAEGAGVRDEDEIK